MQTKIQKLPEIQVQYLFTKPIKLCGFSCIY